MEHYTNFYCCPECGHEWEIDSDSMHNDECEKCEISDIEPINSTDNFELLAESWVNGNKKHVFNILKNDEYVFCCFLLKLADLVENPMDFVQSYKDYLENY